MKSATLAVLLAAVLPFISPSAGSHLLAAPPTQSPPQPPPNPNIDLDAYVRSVKGVAEHRVKHRLAEDDFIKMSREEGTIVLDARSTDKYDLLYIRGAIHLSFPDITIESLKKVLVTVP